jgi:hypothetical protein
MAGTEFRIQIDGADSHRAAEIAKELQIAIQESADDVAVSRTKDDPTKLDMGASLVLVLGTPAIVYVAKAIAGVLNRWGTHIRITKDGALIADNVDGRDSAKIVEALKAVKK